MRRGDDAGGGDAYRQRDACPGTGGDAGEADGDAAREEHIDDRVGQHVEDEEIRRRPRDQQEEDAGEVKGEGEGKPVARRRLALDHAPEAEPGGDDEHPGQDLKRQSEAQRKQDTAGYSPTKIVRLLHHAQGTQHRSRDDEDNQAMMIDMTRLEHIHEPGVENSPI